MTATITSSQVKAFYPTTLDSSAIDMLIDIVDEADTCLEALDPVPSDSVVTMLKIYGVCALLQEQVGGLVTSQSSFTGDSVTISQKPMASGNQYTSILQGMSGGSCILNAIGQGGTYPLQIQRT